MASLYQPSVRYFIGGLNFVESTTDKVTVPNPQAIGAGSSFTFAIYSRQTGSVLVNNAGFQLGSIDLLVCATPGTDNFRFAVPRATTTGERRFEVPQDPWAGPGGSSLVVGTYSESDGPRLFLGHAFKQPTEPTYSVDTTGAGATTADTGSLFINNRSAVASLSLGLDVVAMFWYPRWMSKAELTTYWQNGWPVDGSTFYGLLGADGTAFVRDLSGHGNHGIATGLTQPTAVNGGLYAQTVRVPAQRRVRLSTAAAVVGGTRPNAFMLLGVR